VLIVAWPNRDLIISTLHLLFVAMSQDWLIDAASLSTVCEPDLFDGKDYFQLGLHILGALLDAFLGTPRNIIQQLFCSRQITRLSTPVSSRRVSDRHSFFWHLPVSGSSTWIEGLNHCLRVIQFHVGPPQTQQNFIRSFLRFFFLSLGHHVWTRDRMVKDYSRVTFPVMFDVAPCPFLTKNCSLYQLAGGISHPAVPRTIKVITWRSSEYSADGFEWMTLRSRLLRSWQHSKTTSRKQRDPLNCHYPALYITQLNK
jgi:hypothetical protein